MESQLPHPNEPLLEAILTNQDKNAKSQESVLEAILVNQDSNAKSVEPILEASLVKQDEIVKAIKEKPEVQKVQIVTNESELADNFFRMLRGQKGEQGDKGDSIQGEKGDKGDKGDKGEQGLVGPKGESIKGDKGESGKDGRDGKNGLDGLDGKDGKDGTNGKDGKDGKSIDPKDVKKIAKELNKNNNLFLNIPGVKHIHAGTNVTITGTDEDPIINASGTGGGIALTDLSAGTGISYNNTTGVITNSAPDQTVAITAGTNITSVTGTYPNFTINAATQAGGTVTSVAALTLGTTGTDLSSTVANGTTTPVITLQVPTASATNRGALSAADWSTFNSKQPAMGADDNYVTDAQLVVIGNTSGTNSGNETTSTLGATINGATAAVPNDTDLVATVDTSVIKKITWTNVKAFLKTYFDTLYASANNITARIAGSTYYSVQHIQDLFHSAGWTSGGVISDAGSGLITVTGGTGLIRATDSDIATIYFTDFAASSPANVVLTDGVDNYIYVEYNAGTPRIIATTSVRTDYNTNFRIGNVFRSGTELHINQTDKMAVSDHAGKMIRFNQEVMPYAHSSGAMISETGTRNFAFTTGAFWNGLVKFTTNAFDSSVAGTFSYMYYNGATWVEVATQTQINNTQYNNIASGLATLTNNKYGVHWIYMSVDNHIYVVYGQGDYTLIQAQDAQPPATLPLRVSAHSFIAGKIIIKKSDATYTQIESAFDMSFSGSVATEHNSLGGLQGGTVSEYYHLTSAEYTPTATTGSGNVARLISPTFTTPLLGTPTSGTLTNCTGLPIAGLTASTSTALGVGSIELGHATDTTISRSAAGVLAVEGITVPTISSTSTITGKRNQPRIVSATSYTTDTGTSLDFSTCDLFIVTAQAGALKFNNPSGTPVHGEKIIIRVKDNGTARALTYDTQYRAIGVTLPSTTVISKTTYLGGIWNATDSKVDVIAVAQEA